MHRKMKYLTLILALALACGLCSPSEASKLDPSAFEIIDRADLAPDELVAIQQRLDAQYKRTAAFLGIEDSATPIEYHIYGTFEEKGLETQNMSLGHADLEADAVHVVINDWIRGDDCLRDSQLLIRNHLGEPATRLLEIGLSVYFTRDWRMRGYAYWASRLYASGNAPSIAELLDNNYVEGESYLIMQPLAGTFVAYAIETFGREVFLEQYPQWTVDPGELSSLERGWHRYLDGLVSQYEAQVRRDRQLFRASEGFHKGFCHAHEGYAIFNGYGSQRSDAALAQLADMGTNAISITPFTYQRDPRKPARFRFSHGAGGENDESVIHCAQAARELGMRSMLKPHIWLGADSWPGAIEMTNDADWDTWFNNYYRWIVHYALLAEMFQIDTLCIGVELCKATVGHEDRWAEIIARLRALYSGEMTYAANWGEEFENVALWGGLDYIGINCYYPLSQSEDATEEELRAGAEAIMDRIEVVYKNYRKPVLFTEIGFPSTPKPWMQPHKPRMRIAELFGQATCYEVIFESLRSREWCAGIYWWKWPTVIEYGGRRHTGFTPNNKPAAEVVKKWYGEEW